MFEFDVFSIASARPAIAGASLTTVSGSIACVSISSDLYGTLAACVGAVDGGSGSTASDRAARTVSGGLPTSGCIASEREAVSAAPVGTAEDDCTTEGAGLLTRYRASATLSFDFSIVSSWPASDCGGASISRGATATVSRTAIAASCIGPESDKGNSPGREG